MSGELLQTKLYVPALRTGRVPRAKLTQRLSRGIRAGAKLTLVSAPAGFGKSVLVSEWINQETNSRDLLWEAKEAAFPTSPGDSGRPFHLPTKAAWLSLDQRDNDPVRFMAYLAAALQKVDDKIGAILEQALKAPKLPSLEPLLSSLINDIVKSSTAFMLVLDDYHTISALKIHEAIDFLLEHLPPTTHLVIITRQDPPLSLSRLRGHGLVTEIRQKDLRFTPQEVNSFFTHSADLKLSDSEIELLGSRTEGWIVGLQLAALALKGRVEADHDEEGVASFVAGFSGRHHFILDYLTDEVVNRQPEAVQSFLLRSSVLERMCGPLCDAVVKGRRASDDEEAARPAGAPAESVESSQSILEYLDHANLFLVPLDDERKWYRYHHLFAELLRARLQELGTNEAADLHRRAAIWHEQNGLVSEAVNHALLTGDFTWAADIIERVIRDPVTWESVTASTYLTWLRALPDPVIHSSPWLRLFASRTHFINGEGTAAQRILEDLELWLRENPSYADSEAVLRLVVADRASYAAVLGEVKTAKTYARRALAHLPADDHFARVRPASILGLAAVRAGELREAYDAFSYAYRTTQAGGDQMRFAAIPLACNLADVQMGMGKLELAFQTCLQVLELGDVGGIRMPATGLAKALMSSILYERNELSSAEGQILEGLELLVLGGISLSFSYLQGILARVRQARGENELALKTIQEAIKSAQISNIPRLSILMEAYRARILLAAGEYSQAIEWAQEYRKIGATEYLREFEELTLIRVLLAEGKLDEVRSTLRPFLDAAEAAGRFGSVIEIHALSAIALLASADNDGAIRVIRKALTLAEPEGYVRVFINEGKPMASLLYELSQRETPSPYIQKLLAAFATVPSGKPVDALTRSPAAHASSVLKPDLLIDPLTARELEVLHYLAEGLSNREIAQRLFLSPNTIRSHTYNLYSKLGVHNRMNAVGRARELGLMPS